MTHKYSHVIWDWNGTLFDDVAWNINVINTMLSKRNLKLLRNVSEYHDVFCFPIIDYYRNVGFDFDKEPFKDLAEEFMALYLADKTGNCKLNGDAMCALKTLEAKGLKQVVLSASEIGILLSQMGEFDIVHFFDEILGLSDIYAKSKIEIGLEYVSGNNAINAVLIGDTAHDYEVANALNIDCILVSAGHQSKDKLLACGAPVLDNLAQAVEHICNRI